jgi:hypothetical protein
MLEIRLADNAGLAVTAAAIVGRVEAVDPQSPHTASRELRQSRTSHTTGPEHNYIVCLHRRWSVVSRPLSVDSRLLDWDD